MQNFMKRTLLLPLIGLLLLALFSPSVTALQAVPANDPHAGHDHGSEPHGPIRDFAYSDEMLAAWSRLAVQEGGRIKPLSTLAGFKLLRCTGRRGLKTGDLSPGGKLTPTEWFLDCMFFPEQARGYPCLIVNLKDVAVAVGLNLSGKKKRDRYSYNDLAPVRKTLLTKAQQASRVDPKSRSVVETQIMLLAKNFLELEDILRVTNFAQVPIPTKIVGTLSEVFPNEEPNLPQFLAKSLQIKASIARDTDASGISAGWKSLIGMLEQLRLRNYQGIAMFPPSGSVEDQDEWNTWPDLIELCLQGDPDGMDNIPALEAMGAAFRSRSNPELFSAEATRCATLLHVRAEARGEGQKLDMEVSFYRFDFFYRSLYLFILAFVLIAIAWLKPGQENGGSALTKGSWFFNLAGLALLVTGITYRCILRDRPPISTLYETILFIAAVAVILALFLEWIARNRIGLGLSAFIGIFGMFLASKYELHEAVSTGDTMGRLGAVLDTNYWLATHVTTINMGYAAGILAAFFGHVWVYSAFFGNGRDKPAVRKELARMIYGVLCFSLLFSVLGTLLGGVWANDSWGRFWGWDPKENGALLICLWELLILHMRMAGRIRDFGFAVMNILLGVVIAFSWWGVNLLDVGLHSYGRTHGVEYWLNVFYGVEFAIVLIAIFLKYSKGLGKKNVSADQ